MPVSVFETKVFLQNQMRALTSKKVKELKYDEKLSQDQKVSRRIKHYLNEVVKAIQPTATLTNGDEALNMNITFMGAGAVKDIEKLNAGNVDALDSMLLSVSNKARNILEDLKLETKGMSSFSKTLLSLSMGFAASSLGSLVVGAVADKMFPASPAANSTPSDKAASTTLAPQPNPAAGIGSLVGGYLFGGTAMYVAKKSIHTNEAALVLLSIMAATLCYLKQAPQYADKIIDAGSRLLHANVGGLAEQHNGWHNAILNEIGPFYKVQKPLTPVKTEVAKPVSHKEKQRQQVLAAIEKRKPIEESKAESLDMDNLARYIRNKK